MALPLTLQIPARTKKEDILVADSYYCNYWLIAMCLSIGVHVVMKNHHLRDDDPVGASTGCLRGSRRSSRPIRVARKQAAPQASQAHGRASPHLPRGAFKNPVKRRGQRHSCPVPFPAKRPEGCFAEKVPDTFSPTSSEQQVNIMNLSDNGLTVADVMRDAVKTIPSSMTLPEFEQRLLADGISGYPVVDEGKLVGVVSRSDVIRQICNEREVAEKTSDFYFDETGFYELPMKSFADISDRIGERLETLRVADVMVSHPLTVPMELPIHDLADRFISHRVHRFPVTDLGVLVGIVTTTDLVRMIADRRLVSKGE